MPSLAEQYQAEWAQQRGYSATELAEQRSRAVIVEMYCEVLAEAAYHGIGPAILDDLWAEAQQQYTRETAAAA